MIYYGEAAVIAATFDDKMTVLRQKISGGRPVDQVVYRDLPCAMSRSAHTASPAPPGFGAIMPESRYRISVFMPAGTVVHLGDRVDVYRRGQIFRGSASDSIGYESHSVCVVDIWEVAGND